MKVVQTAVPDLLVIKPKIFRDERGFFFGSFNRRKFIEFIDYDVDFVQDSHSRSANGVFRSLHYQIRYPQGKMVRVAQGVVLDVAVDIRQSSPNFGQYVAIELSTENKRMFWIPEGFAHGFVVKSETVGFLYKTTDYWYSEHERSICWNDPALGINWHLQTSPIVSAKDALCKSLAEAELFA